MTLKAKLDKEIRSFGRRSMLSKDCWELRIGEFTFEHYNESKQTLISRQTKFDIGGTIFYDIAKFDDEQLQAFLNFIESWVKAVSAWHP